MYRTIGVRYRMFTNLIIFQPKFSKFYCSVLLKWSDPDLEIIYFGSDSATITPLPPPPLIYNIQHDLICRSPSDSTVSEDAGIEPRRPGPVTYLGYLRDDSTWPR
jgi:hypothetical protein